MPAQLTYEGVPRSDARHAMRRRAASDPRPATCCGLPIEAAPLGHLDSSRRLVPASKPHERLS